MTPAVSICIPTYCQTDFLKDTLDSVVAQKFQDYELIISDDSPNDSVEKLLEDYDFSSKLVYVRNSPALGSPANWNQAARLAKGQLIKLLHHDDGLIRPSKEYLVIAALLILKIVLISVICKNNLGDMNALNLKEWFRRIVIDLILLMMVFIRLRPDIKKSFYYFCITLFLLDLICNIYNHIHGVSWGGIPLEMRPGDWLGRSGGIFGHPFYSIDISLIALFTALLLRNRYPVPLLLIAVLNLVLAGSQRGMLALALVIVLYALFYWRAKIIYIYLVSALIVGAVF